MSSMGPTLEEVRALLAAEINRSLQQFVGLKNDASMRAAASAQIQTVVNSFIARGLLPSPVMSTFDVGGHQRVSILEDRLADAKLRRPAEWPKGENEYYCGERITREEWLLQMDLEEAREFRDGGDHNTIKVQLIDADGNLMMLSEDGFVTGGR